MERTTDQHWIADRLALTTPTWQPDAVRARNVIDAARSAQRGRPVRSLRLAAAAAAAVIAAVFLVTSGRVVAQELWYRLFASRFLVVRLDLSKVPLDTSISMSGAEQPAASVMEASALAGYAVTLPPPDVLPGKPSLSVLPPMSLSHRVDTHRLRAALAAVGARDVDVPAEWHGVTLRGIVGRTVAASYAAPAGSSDGMQVTVLQMPPVRLEVPADFPLDRLAEAMFRSGGMPWWEARTLSQEYAANPGWLLDAPETGGVTVETVPLGDGTAVVVEEAPAGASGETTVFVSRASRLYAVSSLSRETSLRVAETLR